MLGSPGGTVLAQCTDGRVSVLSASPAPGFTVDDEIEVEDGGATRVEFEAEESEVRVEISCVDGVPQAAVTSRE